MTRRIGHWLAVLFLCVAPALARAEILPTFAEVRAGYVPSEAWVLDRAGKPLQTVRVDRTARRLPWVSLSDLSPAMVQALIASEDKRFMEHGGVDWLAIVSAMWDNLTEGERRGASTLTMQLAGMLDPALQRAAGGRSVGQKWDQIVAARELEQRWSKEQILEAYLNLVSFRGDLVGIGAASRAMFGKAPSGLDKTEASLLAALLRGTNAKPDVVAARACGVGKLVGENNCSRIRGLAFTVLDQRHVIDKADQLAPHLARHLALKPGQSVRTTLDADLQRFVIAALKRQLMELQDREVEDGAVVVLDNASGDVLAWVGSSDATSLSPEVDGVTAPRLPGSTLKPFLYGLAIDRRLLTAASPLEDSPLALDTPLGQYVPQNYEHDFKGWVSVRSALGSSLNVPAVRTLLLVGVDRFYEMLKDLGLKTLSHDAEFYGYSLALGGGEVTLLDLSNAYRSLANGGVLRPAGWLPAGGARGTARPVLSARAAYIIGDILADKSARSLTFGLSSPLETLGRASVKTGTSKDMRDNWCIGYSDRYTVGVWVGNGSGAPMRDVSGITGAAPVWQAVMNHLQNGRPGQTPAMPAGVVARTVHFQPPIEPDRRELFLSGTEMDEVVIPAEDLDAKIQGPGNGAVLALDPDIPASRQKVRFRIVGVGPAPAWYVDDQPADPATIDADGSLLWPPVAGAHRISVRTPDGKTVDAMFVTVK